MHSRRQVWIGLCFLLVGAYLPWVRANPTYEAVLTVGLSGMHSGTETYGLVTLILGLVTALGLLGDLKWVSESSFRVSVDHIGLEEVSAWMRCEAYPSRQRDRGRAPA